MKRVATLLLIASAASCGRTTETVAPPLVVVSQVPAGRGGLGFDPRALYPEGSRVAVLDPARPGAAPRVISEGFDAAGGASVRWDAARIAFVGREHAGGRFAVFTCAPDGSERVQSAEGVADCGSAAFLADGRLVYAAAVSESSWALFTTGAEGRPPRRITFSGGVDVDPTPLADGRIAFASRAPGEQEFRILAVHVDGTGVGPLCDAQRPRALLAAQGDSPVTADAAWRTIASAALTPRAKPQGHLSVVDETKAWGDLFCVDARAPGATNARRVRVTQLDAGGRAIGDVPLEFDGSFFVRVPPDAPLGLTLVDADGHAVAAQHAPIWVRPGETRGCIGCHEDADTAPPNVRPLAVLTAPVPLGVASAAESSR